MELLIRDKENLCISLPNSDVLFEFVVTLRKVDCNKTFFSSCVGEFTR